MQNRWSILYMYVIILWNIHWKIELFWCRFVIVWCSYYAYCKWFIFNIFFLHFIILQYLSIILIIKFFFVSFWLIEYRLVSISWKVLFDKKKCLIENFIKCSLLKYMLYNQYLYIILYVSIGFSKTKWFLTWNENIFLNKSYDTFLN